MYVLYKYTQSTQPGTQKLSYLATSVASFFAVLVSEERYVLSFKELFTYWNHETGVYLDTIQMICRGTQCDTFGVPECML